VNTTKTISNAEILQKYFAVQPITVLDWQLLNARLTWSGFYSDDDKYLSQAGIFFDNEKSRFRANFSIKDGFDVLPEDDKKVTLWQAINNLKYVLWLSFSEIESSPALVYANFIKPDLQNRTYDIKAVYENGELSIEY